MRVCKAVLGVAALVALLAPNAHADEWNKRTYLTFSGPVQIPGAVLQAGSYTFEIANPDTTRHVIRVSEKDSGKHIGLFMTIPNTRLDPPSDNLIMFSERPAGQPQAIHVWFYPGERTGEEFVYPKNQAMAIAKATHKGVLATEGGGVTTASEADRIAAYNKAPVSRIDESGKTVSDNATPAPRTTARAEAPSPSVGTSGSQAKQPAARRKLPRTASNLVLFELLSFLALAAAFGVHQMRRRGALR